MQVLPTLRICMKLNAELLIKSNFLSLLSNVKTLGSSEEIFFDWRKL